MTPVLSGRRVGIGGILVALGIAASLAAPVVAPHRGDERFPDLLNAPPTAIRIRDSAGHLRAPFIHPWRLVDRLEQRYELDRDRHVTLHWFAGGHLVSTADNTAPLLVLGADGYGRDVLARLLDGAGVSLGVALIAATVAMILGGLIGGFAGYAGGLTDGVLTRGAELILVLPAMYVALSLRAVLPLVLRPSDVFALMVVIFGILGAPVVARGVRAIVRSERHRDYVVAAESLGAGRLRVLWTHLLPAARPFLLAQLILLVPSFIVAEATLSYVGFGFPEPVASWGTMLHDASNLQAMASFPWLLSPAAAMFAVVLAINLLGTTDTSLHGLPQDPDGNSSTAFYN